MIICCTHCDAQLGLPREPHTCDPVAKAAKAARMKPADWLGRERCDKCRFWVVMGQTSAQLGVSNADHYGYCHKTPPPNELAHEAWWCGEFQPRPGATPEGKSRYEV